MLGPEQLAAGERAEAAGDYLAAAAAYRSVTTLSDAELAADGYFRLGRVTWRQGRFDGALTAFASARALAERAGKMELMARVENGIGAVHYARGDYDAAQRAYRDAGSHSADPTMHAKIVLNLGVIENIRGNFEAARAEYESAYQLFVGCGDDANATLAVHNRGMVEADLELWDQADASFLTALELATVGDNREMIAKTLVNRSEVLLEQATPAEAVAHCDRALAIYAEVGDEVGRAEALRWRGRALMVLGDLVEAERGIAEALHIAVRSNARLLEGEASRDLGELHALRGDHAGALKKLRAALATFADLGAERDIAGVRSLIERVAAQRNGPG